MTHSDDDPSPSCYICRYLQSFPDIWIHVWAFCANDRRTSTHTTCAHPVRIREEYTSDKIPELHFVWNCNFAGFTYGSYLPPILLSTPTPPSLSSLWLPFYIGKRTACIISTWTRAKEMVDVRGAGGDICGVSLWENNRLLRAWRTSSVGKFTQNVVADRAGGDATVDHCVACAAPTFLTTMTGTSDPIRTSPARSAWAIAS